MLILLACAVIRVAYWTYGADTGTFAIAIGNVPSAMYDPFEGASHFKFHWSPILIALYPLVAISHSVLVLQALQVVVVVGSVFGYYSLIEPYLGRALALRCAMLALLYPPLIALAFGEFHELAFAPLLTFLVLRAAALRAWRWYALWVALLLCVREDVALITGLFGVLLALWGWRRRHYEYLVAGSVTAAGVATMMAVYFAVIVPRVGAWMPSHFYVYPIERGPLGVARALFTVPRLGYLLEIYAPLAFLPLLTRWFWLAVAPLAVVLLANSGGVWRMGMHYVALWLPWVLLAAAAGVAHVRFKLGERAALKWMDVATVLCLLFLVFFNPMHPTHYLVPSYRDVAAVQRALHCVPPGALVGTHDEWYTAIAMQHREVTIGLAPDATYYIFADDYPNQEFRTTILPPIRRQVAAGRMSELCRADNVIVYRRVTP